MNHMWSYTVYRGDCTATEYKIMTISLWPALQAHRWLGLAGCTTRSICSSTKKNITAMFIVIGEIRKCLKMWVRGGACEFCELVVWGLSQYFHFLLNLWAFRLTPLPREFLSLHNSPTTQRGLKMGSGGGGGFSYGSNLKAVLTLKF